MYSVAQASVGVDAHRLPYCSSRTCRAKSQENVLDVRFRVAPQRHLPVESVSGRRNLHPGYRIRDSFGRIPKSSVCRSQYFATASGRRFSLRLRAQAPGDVAETVLREAPQEESDDVLALGYGWKVREASRFDVEELRAVAHVQASSFHIEAGVFDELFFKLFKAEVLSNLLHKAKHSPSDRYACLLAEPAIGMDEGESSDDESAPMTVGAVNLAASDDNEVLRHLHDADEYLYVSGMAVDMNFRRKNVATLLLRACDLLAMQWGFEYLVLHAYEDDMAARTLYARGGYRVIALDPLWMSTWVGRQRRVLMAKKISRTRNFDI